MFANALGDHVTRCKDRRPGTRPPATTWRSWEYHTNICSASICAERARNSPACMQEDISAAVRHEHAAPERDLGGFVLPAVGPPTWRDNTPVPLSGVEGASRRCGTIRQPTNFSATRRLPPKVAQVVRCASDPLATIVRTSRCSASRWPGWRRTGTHSRRARPSMLRWSWTRAPRPRDNEASYCPDWTKMRACRAD